MRTYFKYVIGASALFIAGCSAYFSVKGMGLLFLGSATAVMVMAASMEAGKLVAASFLYQYWHQINVAMRCYLTTAVVVLVGVTSLGIYGYLARAYEETNTRIILLESQIATVERQNEDAQRQIDANRGHTGQRNETARADINQQQQRITDEQQRLTATINMIQSRREAMRQKRERDVAFQQQRITDASEARNAGVLVEERAIEELHQQLAVMDRAVDTYTQEGPGGFLKNDGVRRGQELRQQQRPERERIAAAIVGHRETIAQLRADFARVEVAVAESIQQLRGDHDRELARLDTEEQQLRQASAQVIAAAEARLTELRSSELQIVNTGTDRIDTLHQRIRAGNEEIASLRHDIASTDIGSYRFVARAFDAPVDDVVKWLILLLVAVFDPLAVVLTVGFNVAIMREHGILSTPKPRRKEDSDTAPETPSTAEATPRFARAAKPAVAFCVALLVVGGVGLVYVMVQQHQQDRANHHAELIPADSFAVVTLRPEQLRSQGDVVKTAMASLGAPLPEDVMEQIVGMARRGFAVNRDVYLFVKYPEASTDELKTPVILLGVVAAVNDADAAEGALSELAASLEGILLPRRIGSAGVAQSRSMVRHGRGRYLDPEGGFFTFGLTDAAAMVLIELEGDPHQPIVESEMRLCLEETPREPRLGRPSITLPDRATVGEGAVAVWFDVQRCFAQMPKNAAALSRYHRLQRYLDFDLLLTVNHDDNGQMNVTGDYQYAVDKFGHSDTKDIHHVLAELGGSGDAGMAGALMDQCAGVLDFEPMIMRLREVLAAGQGDAQAHVVVQKTVASPRHATFILEANFNNRGERDERPAIAGLVR